MYIDYRCYNFYIYCVYILYRIYTYILRVALLLRSNCILNKDSVLYSQFAG